MVWEKIRFIPHKKMSWTTNTLLQPCPILINENTIRVFCGMRDDKGISRVGFVDLSAKNPNDVIGYSIHPSLDIGKAGMFDDNGVVPCHVMKHENKLYLYYAGYFLGRNVRFIAFTGLAISEDDGLSFKRHKETPIFDRAPEGPLFRAIHCILPISENKWQVWYGAGNSFSQGKDKTLPNYNIRTLVTNSLIDFPDNGTEIIDTKNDEYRVGRPNVIIKDSKYYMFFGAGSETIPYQLELATSEDAKNWKRLENGVKFANNTDWDNEMKAYPSIININNKTYLFYNGNNYGYAGFICSELQGNLDN